MGRLDGKTVLLIGAGAPEGETSNGSAVVVRMAAEGATMFAVDTAEIGSVSSSIVCRTPAARWPMRPIVRMSHASSQRRSPRWVTSMHSTGTPYPAYIASRAAPNALTRSIATRHGRDGIRCNAMLPGFIDSPMNGASLGQGQFATDVDAMRRQRSEMVPLRRRGTSEDLAGAAVFLASDAASYISGVLLPVDGGFAA